MGNIVFCSRRRKTFASEDFQVIGLTQVLKCNIFLSDVDKKKKKKVTQGKQHVILDLFAEVAATC